MSKLILVVFAALVVYRSLRVARENERLVVLRLGRVHRVTGPGMSWHLPFVDLVLRVDLDAALPGWRGLSPAELERRVIEHAQSPAAPRLK